MGPPQANLRHADRQAGGKRHREAGQTVVCVPPPKKKMAKNCSPFQPCGSGSGIVPGLCLRSTNQLCVCVRMCVGSVRKKVCKFSPLLELLTFLILKPELLLNPLAREVDDTAEFRAIQGLCYVVGAVLLDEGQQLLAAAVLVQDLQGIGKPWSRKAWTGLHWIRQNV